MKDATSLRPVVVVGFVACSLVLYVRLGMAQAQPAGSEDPPREPPPAEGVAPDSPRAAVMEYQELCAKGRFAEAGHFLDLPPSRSGEAPLLARRLKAVLDRYVWLEPDTLSPLSEGSTEPGLLPRHEEIATIPLPSGVREPVRLSRRRASGEAPWVFSRATVDRIDTWYQHLENRWILEHLPEPLLRPGPLALLYWQWLALPLLILLGWAVGLCLSRATRFLFRRVTSRTQVTWDDAVVARTGGPLTLAWMLGAIALALPLLGLYGPAQSLLQKVLRTGFFAVFFWFLLRIVDILCEEITRSPWAKDHAGARSIVPIGSRMAKVLVLAMAVIAVLSELGFPVASLVAGLGIGGLAIALAAQKTVENLFGALSIGVDQPFRVGDVIKLEDFVGTVEAVGLRSTKIRTQDRTLITLPNGKVADMRIESYAARDRIRLSCMLGLVYGTSAAQMREVLTGLEDALRAHPKIWPDLAVHFHSFGDSSLNVEVVAWFDTSEYGAFQAYRQEMLLAFMGVVEKAGTAFAFPTRTVHLVEEKPPSA